MEQIGTPHKPFVGDRTGMHNKKGREGQLPATGRKEGHVGLPSSSLAITRDRASRRRGSESCEGERARMERKKGQQVREMRPTDR